MPRPALALLAHGSPDPRSRRALARLRALLHAAAPQVPAYQAFLGHHGPDLAAAAAAAEGAGHRDLVLVPYLLTSAHHARVDVPAAMATARAAAPGLAMHLAAPVGSRPEVLDAAARLAGRHPGVVLVAGGSGDAGGASQARAAAAGLGARLTRPVVAAFAGHQAPDVATAVAQLRAGRPGAVAVIPYLLAPGVLADRIGAAAAAAGAEVTAPLGPSPELAVAALAAYGSALRRTPDRVRTGA